MKISRESASLDLELLDDLIRINPAHRQVLVRLEKARQQTIRELVTADTWEKAKFLQGRIAGLTLALEMPDQLSKELKAQLKTP